MFSKMIMIAATLAVAEGAAIKWTGIVNDQQWTTANNWYPAQVPGPADAVTIDDAEGKDAIVVMTTPIAVASLSIGNLVTSHARLRVLGPLTVSQFTTVQPNGVLEINSGAAGLSCSTVNVAGQLEFVAGTMVGNTTITGLANFGGEAAKVFEACNINIKSQQTMQAGGSLQFKNTSTIVSNTGIESVGNDFQVIVMDNSKGNKMQATSFSWHN